LFFRVDSEYKLIFQIQWRGKQLDSLCKLQFDIMRVFLRRWYLQIWSPIESLYQISDWSIHKRLRKMHSKLYGDQPTNRRMNQWTKWVIEVLCSRLKKCWNWIGETDSMPFFEDWNKCLRYLRGKWHGISKGKMAWGIQGECGLRYSNCLAAYLQHKVLWSFIIPAAPRGLLCLSKAHCGPQSKMGLYKRFRFFLHFFICAISFYFIFHASHACSNVTKKNFKSMGMD
jgi:hypothetical protein